MTYEDLEKVVTIQVQQLEELSKLVLVLAKENGRLITLYNQRFELLEKNLKALSQNVAFINQGSKFQ